MAAHSKGFFFFHQICRKGLQTNTVPVGQWFEFLVNPVAHPVVAHFFEQIELNRISGR